MLDSRAHARESVTYSLLPLAENRPKIAVNTGTYSILLRMLPFNSMKTLTLSHYGEKVTNKYVRPRPGCMLRARA
jgi:hypothetical protein